MNTSYIYSATRVNALSPTLLQEADIARILEAETKTEILQALKESYLGVHVANEENFNIEEVLQDHAKASKEVLTSIAPNPKILSSLWVIADIHNLRIFCKAKNAEFDQEETLSKFLSYGIYSPDTLYGHAVADTLYRLEPEFHIAYHTGYRFVEEGAFHKMEATLDQAYFAYQKRIAEEVRDLFLLDFVKLQIDLHNLQTRLRTLKTEILYDFDYLFVEGGSLSKDSLSTYENTINSLYSLGGESFWREAVQAYEDRSDSLPLEILLQKYLADYVWQVKYDMFSPASLISYMLQVRLSETLVRMLYVGKTSGVDTKYLQSNVNLAYGKNK